MEGRRHRPCASVPLRLPVESDIGDALRVWLDAANAQDLPGRPLLSTEKVGSSLHRLSQLRAETRLRCLHQATEDADSIKVLEDYASALKLVQDKGFLCEHSACAFPWLSTNNTKEAYDTLEWERANILWNLATLYTNRWLDKKLNNRSRYKAEGMNFQTAASIVHECKELLSETTASFDLNTKTLELRKTSLMAEGQYCMYQAVACSPRPMHSLLAKLAAAAVSLFSQSEVLHQDITNALAAGVMVAPWVTSLGNSLRAWCMYVTSLQEWHQSMVHFDRSEEGPSLARLEAATTFASLCLDFCNDHRGNKALSELEVIVRSQWTEWQQHMQELTANYSGPIPNREALPKISPQCMIEIQRVTFAPLQPELFEGDENLKERDAATLSEIQKAVDEVLQVKIQELQELVDRQTDAGRRALAEVNLPHAVTAYQARQGQSMSESINGLPDDLWERVRDLQENSTLDVLSSSLWQLTDLAQRSRRLVTELGATLDSDVDVDESFRRSHKDFTGHNVEKVQKPFRSTLANYAALLQSAKEGDALVLRRVELLETDPKYKLLKFRKDQLDRLFLSKSSGRQDRSQLDVSTLSKLLHELSTVFQNRQLLLGDLKRQVDKFRCKPATGLVEAKETALSQFEPLFQEIRSKCEKQSSLVSAILSENEVFQRARESDDNHDGGTRSIHMMRDAVDEVDQLGVHMNEGREFYDSVIPKLENLLKQVGDVSARLTMERCEYEDSRIHASTLGAARGLASVTAPNVAAPLPPSDQCVNDEKVASLVAMDFDPERVVEALRQHDNNLEQALNELLSG